MATLDDRLKDAGYRTWVKSVLCIQYAKDGLASFATLKSQELYDSVMKQLRHSNNPSANGICSTASFDCRRHRRDITCCSNCQAYLTELKHYRTVSLNLENSDVKNLSKQPWQMAKLMMNKGQDVSNSDPKNTDISGILNFIGTCTLARNAIQNNHYIDDVQKMRNGIIHTSDMKVTENDFLTNITPTLIQLLQDPTCLLNNPDAQDAVDKINEVKLASFQITKEDEYKALKDMITNIRNLSDDLQTKVHNLETESKAVELKTGSDMEKLLSELTTGLHEGQSDIKGVDELLKELTKKVTADTELATKFKTDISLIQISLKETRQKTQKNIDQLTLEVETCHRRIDGVSEKVKGLTKTAWLIGSAVLSLLVGVLLMSFRDPSSMELFVLLCAGAGELVLVAVLMFVMKKYGLLPFVVGYRDEDKLRQYLKDGYQKTKLEVPVLPDCYNIPVAKIFTPVIITKDTETSGDFGRRQQGQDTHSGGAKQAVTEISSYKYIFYKEDILQKHVFLLGKAGAGKTTFSRYLVDAWCNPKQSSQYDDVDFLKQFDFVFYVQCRFASESESALDMICSQLVEEESLKKVVIHVLNTKPDKCLIIQDGLDEWKGSPTAERSYLHDIPGLPSIKGLLNSVILTTSRPWRIHALSQKIEQKFRVFEIQGIKDVRTLSTTILTELQEPDPETACSAFFKSVHASNMHNLIQTPLMLINALTIWHTNKSLNPSICVNYSHMVEALIKRTKGINDRPGDENMLKYVRDLSSLELKWAESEHLLPDCFQNTDFCKQYKGLIINLGNLAFDLLIREKHEQSSVFSKQETRNYLNEQEQNVCFRIGILSQAQAASRGILKMDSLSFSHKTFQEFLGALWLSINYPKKCIKFHECCRTLDDVFDYGVFIQFLCGLSPNDGESLWQYIAEVTEKSEVIKAYRLHAITDWNAERTIQNVQRLVVQCIEEAGCCSSQSHLPYSIADIYVDKDTTEDQTELLKLLQMSVMITSVRVDRNFEISKQIINSMKNMPKVKYINLRSGSYSPSSAFLLIDEHNLPWQHMSSRSEELPVLEFPQQLCLLNLAGWSFTNCRVNWPSHLTKLILYSLTLTHQGIEQLCLSLASGSHLQHLDLTDMSCSDHGDSCCLPALDLQNHRLEELTLYRLSVESVLLPGQLERQQEFVHYGTSKLVIWMTFVKISQGWRRWRDSLAHLPYELKVILESCNIDNDTVSYICSCSYFTVTDNNPIYLQFQKKMKKTDTPS